MPVYQTVEWTPSCQVQPLTCTGPLACNQCQLQKSQKYINSCTAPALPALSWLL